ncbi:uncharacterized protein AMSG_02045 [Thecamonas trahens ATCC 50062]|uniref:C3H1-type domain-containing protein n=1 Tax=Thecamonas trahens ATCC 50062 TaxID=461836 RepID=A0A0L0DWW3_THETB|nr:hypothetical protein AMSG_02045 [Thecamonas trahens ATCC 50062]KNC56033.1 hypothetical protein AMSG_02045 [Thecamonas trahens ATCC 50062]|eukprot:XP_013761077.1 hypothetical protein AMSG_02045 [Thecamonas trahens ATCC 50062]
MAPRLCPIRVRSSNHLALWNMAGFLEVFVDQTVVLDSANNVESATAVITCPSEPEISFEADITDKVRASAGDGFVWSRAEVVSVLAALERLAQVEHKRPAKVHTPFSNLVDAASRARLRSSFAAASPHAAQLAAMQKALMTTDRSYKFVYTPGLADADDVEARAFAKERGYTRAEVVDFVAWKMDLGDLRNELGDDDALRTAEPFYYYAIVDHFGGVDAALAAVEDATAPAASSAPASSASAPAAAPASASVARSGAAAADPSVCKFFLQSRCAFGASCRFVHPSGMAQAPPAAHQASSGPVVCKFFQSPQGCRFGTSCRFAHQ